MGRCGAVCATVIAVAVSSGGRAQAKPATLDALVAKTDTLLAEVSKLRGLKAKRKVPHDILDTDELVVRMRAMQDDEKYKRAAAERRAMLAGWGMLPPGTDYAALMAAVRTDAVAGYYDLKAKRLVISRGAGGDLANAEMVIAHELVHGLQDQAFDLSKLEDVALSEADAAMARRALVEGDAMALTLELMLARAGSAAPWSNPDAAATLTKGLEIAGATGLERAPLAMREMMAFPYRAGVAFVAALRRRRPWTAVDAAFKKPPRSTEQVMHPERYLAGDEPIAIALDPPPPLAQLDIAARSVWGELGVDIFLRAHGVDPARAALAAEGWGGDRVMVLARPGTSEYCGIGRFDWDSEADAIEAAEAFTVALDGVLVAATLERGTTLDRWFAVDGRVSWVERKGPSVIVGYAVPAWAANDALTSVWTSSGIAKTKKAGTKRAPAKKR